MKHVHRHLNWSWRNFCLELQIVPQRIFRARFWDFSYLTLRVAFSFFYVGQSWEKNWVIAIAIGAFSCIFTVAIIIAMPFFTAVCTDWLFHTIIFMVAQNLTLVTYQKIWNIGLYIHGKKSNIDFFRQYRCIECKTVCVCWFEYTVSTNADITYPNHTLFFQIFKDVLFAART